MRYLKTTKENCFKFLEKLQELGTLYAPQSISEKFFDFLPVEDPRNVVFDYNRTIRPPRRFFFPERESMFTYDSEQVALTEIPLKEEKIIIFGVHPCDIVGLRIVDSEFIDSQPDAYYVRRRKKGIIIGLSCLPDQHCFCNVRRLEFVDAGFDLFFHEIPDGFVVRVGTIVGHKLVDPYENILFEEVTKKDTKQLADFETKRSKMFKFQGNWDNLRYMMELRMDHPMYDVESEKCVGCGNCTLTCPTCRCYDVRDVPNPDSLTGSRIRIWDSCQFRTHGLVAGPHNFRDTKRDRFVNRYHCKNAYCPETTTSYCVGCGRCTYFCPAGIDFPRNLQEIRRGLDERYISPTR